ncbi:cytotoxic translational repressor of toxin-antitoxin stability system [Candidatus Magnetobacterium bavaricum]|uniref:Cytotoxic translational repressor of toxin-antitoxin stability system n=1 Tax=Candidatus Magnetobacterium bavaricum TaxID=29290 RepID=A0A0F3GLF2_9BACT|nr:cytotoxic translational repressor of toxin-antitoxin stability system [Candidatus Magnetobacterium bavaricum]
MPEYIFQKIKQGILNLIDDPYGYPHSKKLTDKENSRRLRVGDYRVIFKIFETERLIVVSRIRHRKESYRK